MCGIVAALPAYDTVESTADPQQMLRALPDADAAGQLDGLADPDQVADRLSGLVGRLERTVEMYSTRHASYLLIVDQALREQAAKRLSHLSEWLDELDRGLDRVAGAGAADTVERIQRRLHRVRDLVWALNVDRVAAAERTEGLTGRWQASVRSAVGYAALNTVFDALDRLEVRGRDSAGVQVRVQLTDADLGSLPPGLDKRADEYCRTRSITRFPGGVSFVYKRASVIGRLGDNVVALRGAVAADDDLHAVLALPSASVTVLAHTRWASVGRISEANAHPVDSLLGSTRDDAYTTAALNGDIDNHIDLREREGIPAGGPTGITTDAKLIPVMMARRLRGGDGPVDALGGCVRSFRGSMAIAAQTATAPDTLLLAVKGSGQGLYVGFAAGCYLVASEVYGLVAVADRYLRIAGNLRSGLAEDSGALVLLDRSAAGDPHGVRRFDIAGNPWPVEPDEVCTAEITTRDIARGGYEHYLEKEIAEAPSSFRKSLRGRVHDAGGRLAVDLGESAMPERLRRRFVDREITELVVIGQGTAAVACRGIASVLRTLLPPALAVRAMPATELSAWESGKDMSATCVVAVSQSGTTTDTNRTVDMVRARGAAILAIVNRRDSDLVHKSDGVLYTSDGRDIEMAVASTKAFYSQVATGILLGLRLAEWYGRSSGEAEDTLLRSLTEMPAHLARLYEGKAQIAELAQIATRYAHWAVVGSGPNRIAAAEARIKLSELCYRTISTDAVEDKKHIDLSAEALVLVCAAGAPPGQIRDLAKEIEIFSAHHNLPIAIVDEGVEVTWATPHVIEVPKAHPALAWILSTAACHLFAYYAARAIDASADDLRRALDNLESHLDAGPVELSTLDAVWTPLDRFLATVREGDLRGVLPSDSAVNLALASLPLFSGVPRALDAPGHPGQFDPVQYLSQALTTAIEDLTRSIDSVKHQAKTVTVGTSREDSDLFDNPLVEALVGAGADAQALTYSVLVALRAYARAVPEVAGATRYSVGWGADGATARVLTKLGVAEGLASRADQGAALRGSKYLVAQSRTVRLIRGLRDGRLVLMVPEQVGSHAHALTLLHVTLRDRLDAGHLTELLELTGDRLAEIRAAVTEADLPFNAEALAALPLETVLLAPIETVIESVKHRAKRPEGAAREDVDLFANPLVQALVGAGADAQALTYPVLAALRGYVRAVPEVAGVTRYSLAWRADGATARVLTKLGVAEGLASRADHGATLSGSKYLVARSGTVRLIRGLRDGRLVLAVPEQVGSHAHALTLLHVTLRDRLDAGHLTELLELTGDRLAEIRAAVTEADAPFDAEALAALPLEAVLLAPVETVAARLVATGTG